MIAVVTGIGWVTAAGIGCGRNDSTFAMPAGSLSEFSYQEIFSRPYHNFGRMDDYSKLGVSAVSLALKDAGLDKWEEKRNIGIIASTVYGCLSTDIDFFDTVIPNGGSHASPNLFTYTLPSCFLGEAAILFGLTGTSFVINEQRLSGIASLTMALECIVSGETGIILSGLCDLGCPPALKGSGNVSPGALFFVIKKKTDSNRLPYGELDLDKNGAVIFNETEITDLIELANECLVYYHSE